MASAHTVVVELIAKGQQAAGEFKKVALASDELAVSQKATGQTSGFMSSGFVKAGVAAAATFGILKVGASVVGDMVNSFTDAAGEVRAFQRVSGASAQDSSRFVFALKAVGVSADQASTGIFMLGKKIGQGKIDLAQYGVEVKRTSKGAVDLTGTVLNIADAYQHMQDPAKRSALAMEAFGRSGKNMLPFLARGRDGIKQLFDEAGRTNHLFSQDDLDRAREFGLATHELGQTLEGLKIKAGGALTPLVTDMTKMLSQLIQLADASHVFDAWGKSIQAVVSPFVELVTVTKKLSDSIGLTSDDTNKYAIAQKYLNDKQAEYAALVAEGNGHTEKAKALRGEISSLNGALGQTQQQVADAMKTTAEKAADADRALKTLKDTMFGYTDAQNGVIGSQLAYERAQRSTADAIDTLNAARAAGKQANESDEQYARRIAGLEGDVAQGFLDTAAAHDAVAKAAVDALTSQQAFDNAAKDPKARATLISQLQEAKGKYGDATGAIQAMIDRLNAYNTTPIVAKTVNVDTSQGTVAVKVLQSDIDRLHGTTVTIQMAVAGAVGVAAFIANGRQIPGHAAGGPVSAGSPYIVGERGPELMVPSSSGRIIPNGKWGGSGPTVIITGTVLGGAESGRQLVKTIDQHFGSAAWRSN